MEDFVHTRREEERQQRIAAFIAAGRQELREHGLDGLTLTGVAARARLSKSLIYFYFRDKEDLAFALANDAKRELLAVFRAAREPSENGRAQLEAIGRAYAAFPRERPEAWEILAHMESSLPISGKHPAASPRLQEAADLGEAVHAEVAAAIRTGQADGSLSAEGPAAEEAAILLWSFLYGYNRLRISRDEAICPFVGKTFSELFDLALAMCSAGVVAPPAELKAMSSESRPER
ncbi:MAG: TetR/AcrR family transcriptional regulator [Opitutales bacterium]